MLLYIDICLQVTVDNYYARCLEDYCYVLSNEAEQNDFIVDQELDHVLCGHLTAYSHQCSEQEIYISWRSSLLCRE